MKRSWMIAALAVLMVAIPARAATVVVPADRDTTLMEHPDGARANGAGPAFFVGRTNQPTGAVRRGLVRFDLASALPPRAIVDAIKLHLTVLTGNPGLAPIRIYRVLADWGEGSSFHAGGQGVPSAPGDATWIHTSYATSFWEYSGGQFLGTASGSFNVDGPGAYVVPGTAKLLEDVRLWTADPGRNFGWILIGDETQPQTAQSFGSREAVSASEIPILEVTYRLLGGHPRSGHGQTAAPPGWPPPR